MKQMDSEAGRIREMCAKQLADRPDMVANAHAYFAARGVLPPVLEKAPLPRPSEGTPDAALQTAVLTAAPQIFRLERMATGVAAVIFACVRQWKLYEAAGYKSMRDYAASELGVHGEGNYKHYARAGAAVWTHYELTARRVLESIAGGLQLYPPQALPPVPPVSVLRALPGALRRLDSSEHAVILGRVERGEVTFEELRSAGRPTASSEGKGQTGQPGEADEAPALKQARRKKLGPTIFEDVPQLEEAASLIRRGRDMLDDVVGGWAEGPGPDVRHTLPKLKSVTASVGRLIVQIEDNLIPRTVCSSCHGSETRCGHCDGAGWLPKVHSRREQTVTHRLSRKRERGSSRSSRPGRSATKRKRQSRKQERGGS